MDVAYYENLAGRLYGQVARLGGPLAADQARWRHDVIEVGEYGLALKDTARILAHGEIASPVRSAATSWRWPG